MISGIPALRLTGVGFYISVCIFGGIFSGLRLGQGSAAPVVVGLLVGFFFAACGVYRLIKPFLNTSG